MGTEGLAPTRARASDAAHYCEPLGGAAGVAPLAAATGAPDAGGVATGAATGAAAVMTTCVADSGAAAVPDCAEATGAGTGAGVGADCTTEDVPPVPDGAVGAAGDAATCAESPTLTSCRVASARASFSFALARV